MIWILRHPSATPERLGLIPGFLNERDLRPAVEQLDANYAHGGGWRPFDADVFTMLADGLRSKYPGDRDLRLIAETKLREEVIRLYELEIVAVVQPDGSYAVARMD